MAEDNSLWRVYMRSPEWAARKVEYYSRHPKVCAACSSTESIHLHHMTYKRITEEIDSDLVPLCLSCHRLVHKFHKSEDNLSLMAATKRFIAYNSGADEVRKSRKPRPVKGRKSSATYSPAFRAPVIRDEDDASTALGKFAHMAYVERLASSLGHVTTETRARKAGTFNVSCSCGWKFGNPVGARRSWRARFTHCREAIG